MAFAKEDQVELLEDIEVGGHTVTKGSIGAVTAVIDIKKNFRYHVEFEIPPRWLTAHNLPSDKLKLAVTPVVRRSSAKAAPRI